MPVSCVAQAAHHHTTRRIEASPGLVLDDGSQGSAEFRGRNHLESQSRVERHVEGHIAECGQSHRSVSVGLGPRTDGHDQFSADAAAPMLRVNVNLFEMSDGGLEDFDVRKPHGHILRKGDPEAAVRMGSVQDVAGRCLGKHGRRGVASKEPGSSEFYRW